MRRHHTVFWILAIGVVLATGGLDAQKGKTPGLKGGPSDAVFRDLGDPSHPSPDRIRSDGFVTEECWTGLPGEGSRYCGGVFTDPETGLTYDGVGPECSRISSGSDGSYSFRTLSSKCAEYPPLPGPVNHRRVVLDLRDAISGVCTNSDASDNLIPVSVNGDERILDACGVNTIDDVQIIADSLFVGALTTLRLHLSLHAPPLANTTQFQLEFSTALLVGASGSAATGFSRTVVANPGQVAVLYKTTVGRGGKLQRALIGEYSMPFALTARSAPMSQ